MTNVRSLPLPDVPVLPASPDPDFDRFAVMVQRMIHVPAAVVTLATSSGLVLPGAAGLREPYMSTRRAELSRHFTDHILASEQPVVIEDSHEHDWGTELDPGQTSSDIGIRAFLGVPLRDAEGRVVGALCALDREPRSFSEREVNDLIELGAICSRALAHRVTTDQMNRARKRASQISRLNRLLLNFSEALGETTTTLDIAHTLRTLSHSALDTDFCALILENGGRFEAVNADGLPGDVPLAYSDLAASDIHPGTALIGDRQPRFFENRGVLARQFPELAANSSALVDAQSYLPIILRGQCAGWIWLGWPGPRDNVVESREVKIALARYASQALERAGLLHERQEAAQTLQEALLATLPAVSGLELAARYLPASTHDKVGGDWYDAIAVQGRTTLIMGDVVGHNIAAAAQMGQLRAMLRGFAVDRSEDPAALLGRLDRANITLDGAAMATALVAQLDEPPLPGTLARLTWSSAGHPQPVLVTPDGHARQLTGATDLLLGLHPGAPRHNHLQHLEPGSTLLLFTDGLVERRDSSIGGMTDELCRVATSLAGQDLETMLDNVLHAMGDSQERDDVAVLAARLPLT